MGSSDRPRGGLDRTDLRARLEAEFLRVMEPHLKGKLDIEQAGYLLYQLLEVAVGLHDDAPPDPRTLLDKSASPEWWQDGEMWGAFATEGDPSEGPVLIADTPENVRTALKAIEYLCDLTIMPVAIVGAFDNDVGSIVEDQDIGGEG